MTQEEMLKLARGQLSGCLKKVAAESHPDGDYGRYHSWLEHSAQWAKIIDTLVANPPTPSPPAIPSPPSRRHRALQLDEDDAV